VKVSAQGTYSKLEASFNITNLTTDPFNYEVTDVGVRIVQPDNSVLTLPAFYDGGTTWRVRHMPTMAGTYTVSGVILNGAPLTVSGLQPASWTVAGPPTSPGFIRVDPNNNQRFVYGNGKRYFPVGEDVAYDITDGSTPHYVTNIIVRLGAAHGNFARVWMACFANLDPDWVNWGPTLPLGQLYVLGTASSNVVHDWDNIVNAADQAGVRFQMTLQHHGQYSSIVNPNWPNNPWNTTNTIPGSGTSDTNGFLTAPGQFFTNAEAIDLTKRKFHYYVARWGYSPSILAWELFNEVEETDAAINGQWTNVQTWHDTMYTFIRSIDTNYHHLITTSADLPEPIWDEADYYTHHEYPSDVINGLADTQSITGSQPVRPQFGTECGVQGTALVGVDAPLFAGLMNGQSGGEQPWDWDQVDGNNGYAPNDYSCFRAANDFVTLSGWADQNVLNKSAPPTTGGAPGALTFAPGGGFNPATQSTFVVGNLAPPGIGTLPSYLQGNYHRSETPNGYVFIVNYPQAGTFSVQVTKVASAGGILDLYLGPTLMTSIVFPTNGGGDNGAATNYTASISVPMGSNTITVSNGGQDWLLIGNITLNPYAPTLAAYAVGNSNWNATWLWNQTNVFLTNASASLAGTVQVAGLNNGTYSATWFDTFAGVAISNFSLTVPDTNPVTVNTPSFLRSIGLYVGLPPRANLSAANLTQTLGTNSSLLSVPVAIGNGGGLPLGYSLVVTNANPVAYGAINSTQPGGPVFTWKDISSIGTNISSNFTALASPKAATDEGIAGPINIGFPFPFFTNSFTQLYVSPNGFVTFSPFKGDASTNHSLPSASAPTNCIAFFWQDLILGTNNGQAYAFADPISGTFTLEFQNVILKGTANTVSCQLVLKTTGEILMNYEFASVSNACSIGVQNATATQGTTVAFDQNYLQTPYFSVLLTPTPWLRFDSSAGYVSASASNTVNFSFSPAGLSYGTNTATVLVQTTDGNNPLFTLPVSLTLTSLATWRQTWFGTSQNSGNAANTADPANDGIPNLIAYAFGLNPLASNALPITATQTGDFLTVVYTCPYPPPSDISYVPEVSSGLDATAVWNSGPAYISNNVVINGNGTQTVTMTDLAPISQTPEHYMQIQILAQ
jgi:hypothetical protein